MVASAPPIGQPTKPPNPLRLLSSLEVERLAYKEGEKKTVFYSAKTHAGYVRTGQYLGEWRNNKYEGKGTLESDDGTRYVGEWRAGKRNGMGTLWIRKEGKLYKQYTGQWVNDLQEGRGACIAGRGGMGKGGRQGGRGRE